MNPFPTIRMNFFAVGFLMIVLVQIALASITVTIGNGVRISAQGTQTRYKDPYKCYWDCDLVGCQLSRFDDECAYDCEKVCRSRYDYVGRSDNGAIAAAAAAAEAASNNNIPTDNELKPKSSAPDAKLPIENLVDPIDGQTVRLYMPKNVTVTKFGIWERCAGQEGSL